MGNNLFIKDKPEFDNIYFFKFRYNLSTYPFLSLVPDAEDIDFKCDGLHDGFYASLKYSCQVNNVLTKS